MLALLFAAALLMPELYFNYYDRKKEDQISYLDMEVDTFRVQYDSFEEKLLQLAENEKDGMVLEAALIREVTDEETKKELLSAMNRELNKMWWLDGIWQTDLGSVDEWFLSPEEVISCKLYTAYPAEEDSSQYQGISFWSIECRGEDTKPAMKVLLDTEFQKIYSMKIEEISENDFRKQMEEYYGMENWSPEEWYYIWLDGITDYYELADVIMTDGIYGFENVAELSESVMDYEAYMKEEENQVRYLGSILFYTEEYVEDLYLNCEFIWGVEGEELQTGYLLTGFCCMNDFIQL